MREVRALRPRIRATDAEWGDILAYAERRKAETDNTPDSPTP